MSARDIILAAAGSTTAVTPDPYFPYVSLLLHGDGTNGGQNNTFIDSSSNNFTITRNGSVTQGSFSPYGSLWSSSFNGSTGALDINNSTIDTRNSNWTIEVWIYPTAYQSANYMNICNQWRGANGYPFYLFVDATGVVSALFDVGSVTVTGGTALLNQWTHVALVSNGNVKRIYVNGVSGTPVTYTVTGTPNNLSIGRNADTPTNVNYFWIGSMSNMRINNTTAVYTSNFTPPTQPLTAISGTSLLVMNSNRFYDSSANNYTITVSGSVTIQRASPFSPTAAYSTSVIGGSGYFAGTTSDYLSVPANSAFNFGTGDYTIEAWVYINISTGNCIYATGGAGSSDQFTIEAGGICYWDYTVGGSFQFMTTNDSFAWTHLAIARSGTTTRAFKNGVLVSTWSSSTSIGSSVASLFIGMRKDSIYPLLGYMNGLRLVKGTALYTANFTAPTAPLSNVSNTSLLTNYVNGAIFDNAMMNDLQTVSGAQISTSVKKFGTGSLAFNGTTDYLSNYAQSTMDFGTGNFTVEGWFYTSNSSTRQELLGNYRNSTLGYGIGLNVSASRDIVFYLGNTTIAASSGSVWTASQWVYFAIVRSGTTVTIYINGTSVATGTSSASISPSGNVTYIGATGTSSGTVPTAPQLFFNGYIDDLRFTKGVARYTTNFTPPTAAFPNQ